MPAYRRANTGGVRRGSVVFDAAPVAAIARRACRLRHQAQPGLRRPRRARRRRSRRPQLPPAQRRETASRLAPPAFVRHPVRHVLARRTAGHGDRAATYPSTSGLRGHHLQGHPGRARDPLSRRAGNGHVAVADESLQRPSQPAPGRHRHRRRSRHGHHAPRRAAQSLHRPPSRYGPAGRRPAGAVLE